MLSVTLIVLGLVSACSGSPASTAGAAPSEAVASEAAVDTTPLPTGSVLLEETGTGASTTKEFQASGNSVAVSWTYDCAAASAGEGAFAVYFYGIYGSPALSDELTNGFGSSGSDATAEPLNGNTGPFHVEIDTECSWTLKVVGAP